MIEYMGTVTCDKCGYSEEFEPSIFYRDYSGRTPFIDISDEEDFEIYRQQGFKHVGDKWLCENCAEMEDAK